MIQLLHLWSTVWTVNNKTAPDDTKSIINNIGLKLSKRFMKQENIESIYRYWCKLYSIKRNHFSDKKFNDNYDIVQVNLTIVIYLVTTITGYWNERFLLRIERLSVFKKNNSPQETLFHHQAWQKVSLGRVNNNQLEILNRAFFTRGKSILNLFLSKTTWVVNFNAHWCK